MPVVSNEAEREDSNRWVLTKRVAARLLDGLWQLPIAVYVVYAMHELAGLQLSWALVSAALVVCIIQAAGEAILVWTFGTTPGQALVGLQVLSVETARAPSFRASMLRALKVTIVGMALWVVPLTVAACGWLYWRARTGHALPWERGGDATKIVPYQSGRRQVAAIWLLAFGLPLLVALWSLPYLGAMQYSHLATPVANDVRRSVTGKWTWLHPLSGKSISLDSRWRLLHESVWVRQGNLNATFAFGEGKDNLVRLSVEWRRHRPGSPCIAGELDMVEAGQVVISAQENADATCAIHGGAITATGVVQSHSRSGGLGTKNSSYRVFRTFNQAQVAAEAEVNALAEWLNEQVASVRLGQDGIETHYWRNELSGVVAAVPGAWALDEVNVGAGPHVTYTFVRWPGKAGPPSRKDAVFVSGFSRSAQAEVDVALQEVLSGMSSNGGKVTRRVLDASDTLYEVVGDAHAGRLLTKFGAHSIWVLAWSNNESGTPPGSAEDHELLKRLLRTLK